MLNKKSELINKCRHKRKFTLEAWSSPKIKKDFVKKEVKPCEIKTRPCEIKLRKLDLDDIILSPNSKSSKESISNNNTLLVNNRQTRTSNRNRIKNPHYYDEEWIT